MVNADIGKPQIDCNPFKIDLMYLKDCGGCEVKPKGGDKGIVVDETKGVDTTPHWTLGLGDL